MASRLALIRAAAERRFERKSRTARGKRVEARSVYTDDPELRAKLIPKLGKRTYRVALSRRVTPDDPNGIDCRICGRRLSQLQIHITRVHGISCDEYREKHGADAPLMCERLLKKWVTETIPAVLVDNEKRVKARHEREPHRTCVMCGSPFKRPLAKHWRETCSTACFSSFMTEKAKKAVADGIMNGTHAPARMEYLAQMKAARAADRVHECPICGRTWTSTRRSKLVKAGVCSLECRTEWVRRRGNPSALRAVTATINGETKSVADWARQIGVELSTMKKRIAHGWPEDQLLAPPRKVTRT